MLSNRRKESPEPGEGNASRCGNVDSTARQRSITCSCSERLCRTRYKATDRCRSGRKDADVMAVCSVTVPKWWLRRRDPGYVLYVKVEPGSVPCVHTRPTAHKTYESYERPQYARHDRWPSLVGRPLNAGSALCIMFSPSSPPLARSSYCNLYLHKPPKLHAISAASHP